MPFSLNVTSINPPSCSLQCLCFSAATRERRRLHEDINVMRTECTECKGHAIDMVGRMREIPQHMQRNRDMDYALLAIRASLIEQIHAYYPIVCSENGGYSICRAQLSSHTVSKYDDQLAIVLGFISHVLLLVGKYLQVPLRYHLCYHASRSSVQDRTIDPKVMHVVYLQKDSDRRHWTRAVSFISALVEQLSAARSLSYAIHRPLLFNIRKLLLLPPVPPP
mmetsp:Transcript_9330/g.29700  ORF Transcript_9330/g.29700 Transcript_9330/m.29700 type:complete len:222 (+) Transcript_9330:125-790(+)